MGIHATFALANRQAIEDEIERLIALLDACDGDCDLEDSDDQADDFEDLEQEHGAVAIYGVDQSRGPTGYPGGRTYWEHYGPWASAPRA